MTAADRRLLAVARTGLPGAPAPPRDGWGEHVDEVIGHGLAGLFSAGAAAGLIDIDASMAEPLQHQLYTEAVRSVQLEGELLRLAPALERLEGVVLGGPVLAHGAYSDPLLRPLTHLDLLVGPRRVPDAVAALASLGYVETRQAAEGSSGADAPGLWFQHPGGVVIELRDRLVTAEGPEAGVAVADLVTARRWVRVGSHRVPAPPWEGQLLVCALRAVDAARTRDLLILRDIAEIVHHPSFDARVAADAAMRWGIWPPVGLGLRAVRDGFGLELPAALRTLVERIDDTAWQQTGGRQGPGSPAGNGHRVATWADRPVAGHNGNGSGHALPGSEPHEPRHHRALDPGPDVAPAVPATVPGAAVAVRSLAQPVERTVPGPRWPADQHGSNGHATAGVFGGRQAAWTQVRPPRQATRRTRTRQASGGGDRGVPGEGSDPHPVGDLGSSTTDTLTASRQPPPPKGVWLGLAGGAVLLGTAMWVQNGMTSAGAVLVPVAALLFVGAISRRIARRNPDEAWVGRWLVLAVVVKLTASWLRYQTMVGEYGGVSDATGYDSWGRRYARAWLTGGTAPELPDLRRHNFVRWFTGAVYYVVGPDILVGFLVFGLLALTGSYLWYRATVSAVPDVNRRLYLGLVLFVPSITFWPSAIGKESLMQLGIGVVALATANLLRVQLFKGLVLGLAGGWLLWVVRPHLLALVAVASGCAYLAGRVRAKNRGFGALLGRPVGLIAVAVLMALTISLGADSLGIEDLSLSSIEAELDEQTERSAEGGSQFDNGGNSLNPIYLPRGAVTVLLRPFPWETTSALQLLSSLESALLAAFIVLRLPSLKTSLARARSTPFLLCCWVLTILYSATFSSFANFGLLVRQRSLVLPALFVLLAVNPARKALPPPTVRSRVPTGGARAGR